MLQNISQMASAITEISMKDLVLPIALSLAVQVGAVYSVQASTVGNSTTECKYVNAKGRTVYEKQCLVYFGSLMAIEGVRKCNWAFYEVHFTSKNKTQIWISAEPEKCSSSVNGIDAKSENNFMGTYNILIISEEGELFYLNTNRWDE